MKYLLINRFLQWGEHADICWLKHTSPHSLGGFIDQKARQQLVILCQRIIIYSYCISAELYIYSPHSNVGAYVMATFFLERGGVCFLNGFFTNLEVHWGFAYLVFVLLWPGVNMYKVYFDYPPIYWASLCLCGTYIHPFSRTEPRNDFVDQWIFERFQSLFVSLIRTMFYTYIHNDLRPSIDIYYTINKINIQFVITNAEMKKF